MDFCYANVVGSLNKCIGSVTNKELKKNILSRMGAKEAQEIIGVLYQKYTRGLHT